MKILKTVSAFIIGSAMIIGCSRNPITGRNQLSLVSESELQQMGNQQYRQFLSENKVVSPSADRDAEMVRRVGQRVVNAITTYHRQKGIMDRLEGYKWEYNLVSDNQINAWCMPGGKIVVYTGLLPVTRNEAALAAVMGHEISHALFQHGNERMSQGMVQQGLGSALSLALSNRPAETQNIFLQAYGVGSTVLGTLPFSRKQESEADHYGLIWMAMAGYNPNEAVALWERMAQVGGSKPPQILSSHPSDETRIRQIREWLPEAMKYYKPMGK
ncbi:M48 family peptidase [Flaviaesturariibacter flavus]|uniref:M48 family peptidase n=1 Tax=Flaviaesturariibacter flavus TaxID=2502780 RepID=A0A4R1BNT3_9BACT|nr:M48 family metallopeptidase [Flaviaesturariibacter flavus]TCJ19214.1 M48 family peptidase [Flaviaesturariibacter flavus]